MFKLTSDKSFTSTVIAMVPVDGGHEAQPFKVKFKVISVENLSDTGSLESQQDLLRQVVIGFDDVQDDAGAPVPFSDAMRDQLIAIPYVRAALLAHYIGAVTKAKTGN